MLQNTSFETAQERTNFHRKARVLVAFFSPLVPILGLLIFNSVISVPVFVFVFVYIIFAILGWQAAGNVGRSHLE